MMKSIVLMVLTASLMSVGCAVPNDSPIRINGARAILPSETLGEECEASEFLLISGSLDIASTTGYFIQFDVESDLQGIDTATSNGEVIADNSRNSFYADTMLVSYTSTPPLTFEDESLPIHFVVQPSTPENFIRLNLLTTKAVETLNAAVLVGDTFDLRVNLQFQGNLASGQRLSSNRVVYPIQIRRSNFNGCAAPASLQQRTGPCGTVGGQDGAPIICCVPEPTDPLTCAA